LEFRRVLFRSSSSTACWCRSRRFDVIKTRKGRQGYPLPCLGTSYISLRLMSCLMRYSLVRASTQRSSREKYSRSKHEISWHAITRLVCEILARDIHWSTRGGGRSEPA